MYVVGYHSIQTFSRNGEAASQQFNQAVGLQPEPSLLLHNHHHKAAFNTFREDVHRNRQEGDRGDFIFIDILPIKVPKRLWTRVCVARTIRR